MIVEDGTGILLADSYVSLAEADAYFTATKGADNVWSMQEAAKKELLLMQATAYLDAVYQIKWVGAVVDKDQSLCWPRTSHIGLPKSLTRACMELAFIMINKDVFSERDGKREVESFTDGVISVKYKQKSGGKQMSFWQMILAPLVRTSATLERS